MAKATAVSAAPGVAVCAFCGEEVKRPENILRGELTAAIMRRGLPPLDGARVHISLTVSAVQMREHEVVPLAACGRCVRHLVMSVISAVEVPGRGG